jgi:hypothetical protein
LIEDDEGDWTDASLSFMSTNVLNQEELLHKTMEETEQMEHRSLRSFIEDCLCLIKICDEKRSRTPQIMFPE